MLSHAELKRVRSLQQKKYRAENKRFLVQGRKVVAELLASRVRTEALFASEEAAEWIGPAAARIDLPVSVLAPHELNKLGTFETGNELVAVAVEPEALPFRAPASAELMLALDGIHDPRNMGGLLRIADWFGVSRLLCSAESMEIYNPKVVQSSMGSIFRVEVRYTSLAEELSQCFAAGASVYLASMDGTPAYEANLTRPAVLVLGSESHGLSGSIKAMASTVLSIPRIGQAESLNVAMAASALCAEFARQLVLAPRSPAR